MNTTLITIGLALLTLLLAYWLAFDPETGWQILDDVANVLSAVWRWLWGLHEH